MVAYLSTCRENITLHLHIVLFEDIGASGRALDYNHGSSGSMRLRIPSVIRRIRLRPFSLSFRRMKILWASFPPFARDPPFPHVRRALKTARGIHWSDQHDGGVPRLKQLEPFRQQLEYLLSSRIGHGLMCR